jgi:hypothetical protein
MRKRQRLEINLIEIEQKILDEPAILIGDIAVKDITNQRPYIESLDLALNKGILKPLIHGLKGQHPIHALLLPAIAELLERADIPSASGRNRAFTPIEKKFLHKKICELCAKGNLSIEQAVITLASEEGILPSLSTFVSESSIRRAFSEIDKNEFEGRFAKLYGAPNKKNVPS